jgi:hypothetical protein
MENWGQFGKNRVRSMQRLVQGVNNMAFSVGKHVLVVERYLKAESFKTTQVIYSHRVGRPAPAKYGVWTPVKQARRTGNVNIPKRVFACYRDPYGRSY